MDYRSQTPFSIPSRQSTPATLYYNWSPAPPYHGQNLITTTNPDQFEFETSQSMPISNSSDQTSVSTASTRGHRLPDDEKIAVFNSCLELQQEWLQGANREQFWRSVSHKFEASTNRPYKWDS